MTNNNMHRKPMAELVRTAASALYAVAKYWEANDLPGDFSTPETGYPFDLSLDDVCANVWGWAEALEAPVAEPTTEQLGKWAHEIMGAIVEDIAEHRVPLGLRTFGDLHSYVDANDYLLQTTPAIPWGNDAATQDDPDGNRWINAVTDRVQVLLIATADMLAYELTLACTVESHEHTDHCDISGVELDYLVPMVCSHCYAPTHYDRALETYQHDEPGKPCWLHGDDEQASRCQPDYCEVNLDVMVDILKRLGIPATTEMTGGGVATVYAGKLLVDTAEERRYQACAGPGWFEGPYYSQPRATFAEFYIGPDDDGESALPDSETMPTTFIDAIGKIIALCK